MAALLVYLRIAAWPATRMAIEDLLWQHREWIILGTVVAEPRRRRRHLVAAQPRGSRPRPSTRSRRGHRAGATWSGRLVRDRGRRAGSPRHCCCLPFSGPWYVAATDPLFSGRDSRQRCRHRHERGWKPGSPAFRRSGAAIRALFERHRCGDGALSQRWDHPRSGQWPRSPDLGQCGIPREIARRADRPAGRMAWTSGWIGFRARQESPRPVRIDQGTVGRRARYPNGSGSARRAQIL